MSSPRSEPAGTRLVVNPLACDGIGLCAHLAPGVVELDWWGFPVVPVEILSRHGARLAGRAARACPRQALTVIEPAERRA